ncbi:XRE family transcriptional regulator [Pseudonocardiaceae bacterium YIM PH 21723]|nr:XRE family transcriptional regulator [Pseudonocardiaceae bacterium YIM PH 21723]
MDHELSVALRAGPFHRALQLAIKSRGLSLERLHAHLLNRGVQVSLASLSYWQRGRSRPEQAKSMRAVRELENILGLAPDELVALLGPRRKRGRWVNQAAGATDFRLVTDYHEQLDQLSRAVGGAVDHLWDWLGCQEHVMIGRARDEKSVRLRLTVRARVDNADRFVLFYRGDQPIRPDVHAASYCRVGRVRTHPSANIIAVELLFGRPLMAGQTHLFEFEIGYSQQGPPSTHWVRGLRLPVNQYSLRVQFDPAMVPARAYRTWKGTRSTETVDVMRLHPDVWSSVHFIETEATAGQYGIRWEWY